MELLNVMRQAGACREFLEEDVPDHVLYGLFDAARFAPSGGNRQPVRHVVVRDPAVKRRLRDLYLGPWDAYVDRVRSGALENPLSERVLEEADRFARGFDRAPVIVVVCAVHGDLHITDGDLGRPSVVGGASIYPAVQNLLLACRDAGLGAALTTLLCQFEPEVRELLHLPEELAVVGFVSLGRPAGRLPTRLRRMPVEETVFLERYGRPLRAPA